MISQDDFIKVMQLLFEKKKISEKEFKTFGLSKTDISCLLDNKIIYRDKNSGLFNSVFIVGDLFSIYEFIIKINNTNVKEKLLYNLLLLGFNSLEHILTIIEISFKSRNYNLLFEAIKILINNEKYNKDMNVLLFLLTYITKIPPQFILDTDDIPIKFDFYGLSLIDEYETPLYSLFSNLILVIDHNIQRRKRELLKYINDEDFDAINNFKIDISMECKISDYEKCILYINDQILNIKKGIFPKVNSSTSENIEILISNNDFVKALKIYRRRLKRKNIAAENDPLVRILEKIVIILHDFNFDNEERIINISKYVSTEDDIDLICEAFSLNLEERVYLILVLAKNALANQNKKFVFYLLELLNDKFVICKNPKLHLIYNEIEENLYKNTKDGNVLKKDLV